MILFYCIPSWTLGDGDSRPEKPWDQTRALRSSPKTPAEYRPHPGEVCSPAGNLKQSAFLPSFAASGSVEDRNFTLNIIINHS